MDTPFINIHTHRAEPGAVCLTSVRLTEALQLSAPAPFCAGIHPWDAAMAEDKRKELLAALEMATGMAAIGEIGLDYACAVNKDVQQKLFDAQLAIAVRTNLPVVLHCVRAFEPIMQALAYHRPAKVIFHGFSGSTQQALAATQKGYFLSYNLRNMFSSGGVAAMKNTPVERIFFETDDSPALISEIYERAASIMDVPIEELQRQTARSYNKIFR